ncbi:MAG: RimK family alpha-L-glutamate ligase [Nocardioides sp.]|uniref:ATP-grasp domain-containing protein n=1 Tax=Nocardioides sp. TaxID=35761 RepID=UPI003F044F3D
MSTSRPGPVLLVTCTAFAEGEPRHPVLDEALAARGVEARWVCWDDPAVDWTSAGLVAVRASWDYVDRADEFLQWCRSLDQARLLNGADVFVWNHDKSYLAELAADGSLPVVPTVVASGSEAVRAAVAATGPSVVKPAVGAGGDGLLVVTDADDPRLVELDDLRRVVQPLVESVRTDGESSVFVIGGVATSQVDKWPGADEVRVHEHRGGRSTPVPVADEQGAVARAAYEWVQQRFGRPVDYLRVDLLRWQDRWAVSELEMIEPGLYLDVLDDNAAPFADLVVRALGR